MGAASRREGSGHRWDGVGVLRHPMAVWGRAASRWARRRSRRVSFSLFSQASCKRTETSQLFGNRGLPVARQCPYDTSTSAPYADWTSIPSFKSLAWPIVPASNLNKASPTKHRIELLLPGAETNDARLDASDISVTSEPVQFCCFIIFGFYYSFFCLAYCCPVACHLDI